MLTLDLATAPRWIDLAEGVRVLARPLDRITRAAAEGAALAQARALLGERTDYDRSVFNGIYVLIIVRLLARRLVTEWEGVGDVAGEPLALSEPALDALMERDDMLTAFWDAVIGRPDPVSAEGNG